MKRVFLIVIDGLGVGYSEDANLFGDVGSNTFLNVINNYNANLPTLTSLGIKNIDGLNLNGNREIIGNYGKLREISMGKDTTTGHFEMMGIVNKQPMPTFPNGFPKEVVERLEAAFGAKLLGNKVASGTQIIDELGEEHCKTGSPIVYTSADSVLQIACHVDIIPIEKLYDMCKKAREIMGGQYAVGRVIARPFAGKTGDFYRLGDLRKDYALIPDKNNAMYRLVAEGKDVVAVGKISDIFANQSITQNYASHNNIDAIKDTLNLVNKDINGLIFVNLIDTDMIYGHRNDIKGYAECLEKIDSFLNELIGKLNTDDILIVTGDHGNDPSTESTDHSREFTPLLIYGKSLKTGSNLGVLNGFNNIGEFIEDYLLNNKKSLIGELLWRK